MPIVAVLSEKGGSGKTTISSNLSRFFQKTGESTLLIDSDPQGSARDWHSASGENSELPTIVAMDRATQFKNIHKFTKQFKWIIIDGAPKIEDLIVAAIKVADIILIPIIPSPLDIWAAESLVQIIKTRQEIANGKPKAAFLISRQVAGTKISNEARKVIEGYGLNVFNSCTCQRVIYPNSMANGSTVLDDEPKGPASKEISNISKEVAAWG